MGKWVHSWIVDGWVGEWVELDGWTDNVYIGVGEGWEAS